MGFLYSVVGFIIAIGVLVAVHEFGHFWVARKLGVKVLRYSIGFGKPLWTKVAGEDKIEYVIAAIPLGGYVKMLGEGDPNTPVQPHEAHRAFDNQPIWKRTLIVAAGPGINFLFAILLFFILGMMSKEGITPTIGDVPIESVAAKAGIEAGDTLLEVDGRVVEHFGQQDLYVFNQVLRGKSIDLVVRNKDNQTNSLTLDVSDLPIYNISPSFLTRTLGLVPVSPQVTTEIDRILAGSPAEKAGLQVGDKVVAIDNQTIDSWQRMVELINASPEQEITLSVQRDNVLTNISLTPALYEEADQKIGRIGVGPKVLPYDNAQIVAIERGFLESVKYGIDQTWLMSSVTVRMLWKMLTLQVSHQNISGPITIAQVAGEAIQVGLDYYLHILAVISISLGVMNLLPIPMLDGGHLLMYAIESVAGKGVSEKAFAIGQRLGIVFLACLMSLAFYNDIFRLLN